MYPLVATSILEDVLILAMFDLLFGGFGGLMFLVGLSAVRRNRRVARWPTALGVVSSSELEVSSGTSRDSNGCDTTYTMYAPKVVYTYTVDGQVYDSNTVGFSVGTTTNKEQVQACIDRYPVNGEISVRYDPSDPSVGHLEVRSSVGGIILICFGGGLAAIALTLTVLVVGSWG